MNKKLFSFFQPQQPCKWGFIPFFIPLDCIKHWQFKFYSYNFEDGHHCKVYGLSWRGNLAEQMTSLYTMCTTLKIRMSNTCFIFKPLKQEVAIDDGNP